MGNEATEKQETGNREGDLQVGTSDLLEGVVDHLGYLNTIVRLTCGRANAYLKKDELTERNKRYLKARCDEIQHHADEMIKLS